MEKNQSDYCINTVLPGNFKILKKIGSGGMANVYLGLNLVNNSYVAIKILKREYVSDGEYVRRFDAEAKSASKLNHPNIVKVYGVGEYNGLRYIIMQFISGITLKEIIEKNKKLAWDRSLSLIIQVCQAIQLAHVNGIIHRDVKPQNILVTDTDQAFVTDFGIARSLHSNTITVCSMNGAIGTAHYFAPEQARGLQVDVRTDIYSIGVVLYEMLTGILPFDDENPIEVAIKHLSYNAVAPHIIDKNIPKGISDIIMRCLRKNPAERYQSISELLQELLAFRENPYAKYGSFVAVDNCEFEESHFNKANFNMEKMKILEEKMRNRRKKRFIENLLIFLLVLLLITVLLLSFFMISKKFFKTNDLTVSSEQKTKDNIVANYLNKKIDDVIASLEKTDIKYSIVTKESPNDKKDLVIEQNLPANTKISSFSQQTLILTVGAGENIKIMPDLKNLELNKVQSIMDDKNIAFRLEYEYSKDVEKGKVVRSEPEFGSKINDTSSVIVYISNGAEAVVVPDLTGLTKKEAERKLKEAGLQLGNVMVRTDLDNPDIDEGIWLVIETRPEAGRELKNDAAVDIILKKAD